MKKEKDYLRSILGEFEVDDAYLENHIKSSLNYINSHGKKTFYSLENMPNDWTNVVILGAYVSIIQDMVKE